MAVWSGYIPGHTIVKRKIEETVLQVPKETLTEEEEAQIRNLENLSEQMKVIEQRMDILKTNVGVRETVLEQESTKFANLKKEESTLIAELEAIDDMINSYRESQ